MPLSTIASMGGNYVADIFEDALFVAREESVMLGLVTRFSDSTSDNPRHSLEYPKFAAQEVAETDDFDSPSELTKTLLATLTPVEIICQSRITDRRAETDPQGAQADAARELGSALADHIDNAILSAFANLTGPALGDGTAELSWSAVFAARTQLAAAKVPPPYSLVLHPYQWHPLAEAASVAGVQLVNGPQLADAINSRWLVAQVAGINIYVSANVPVTTGPPDTALGALFNAQALALDIRRPPRLEPERDASARLTELDFTAKYAAGVWRPKFGAKLDYTATAPTG